MNNLLNVNAVSHKRGEQSVRWDLLKCSLIAPTAPSLKPLAISSKSLSFDGAGSNGSAEASRLMEVLLSDNVDAKTIYSFRKMFARFHQVSNLLALRSVSPMLSAIGAHV